MASGIDINDVAELREAIHSSIPLGMPCGDLCSQVDSEEELEEQYMQVPEQQVSEVVFVREHVCVWPTRSRCISGRLSLVKQHCELFMAWLPYACGQLQQDGSFQPDAQQSPGTADGLLYAVLPLPVSEVRWVRPVAPRHLLGARSHRLEVGLVSGVTLPPLHFPPGTPSMHKFVDLIRKHVGLMASPHTKDTWLVNAVPAPLARSLDALDLGDICLGAPARAPGSGGLPAAVTWPPPPPAPAPVPSEREATLLLGGGGGSGGTMWPSWSSWVTHAETVWDAFSAQPAMTLQGSAPGSSSSSSQSPVSISSGNRAAGNHNGEDTSGSSPYGGSVPALTSPSLSLLGRAAWHAVSTGVSKLVAQYSMYGDWFAADWDAQPASACGGSQDADACAQQGRAGGAAEVAAGQQQQQPADTGAGGRVARGQVDPVQQLQQLRREVQQEAHEVFDGGQPWAVAPDRMDRSSGNNTPAKCDATPGLAGGGAATLGAGSCSGSDSEGRHGSGQAAGGATLAVRADAATGVGCAAEAGHLHPQPGQQELPGIQLPTTSAAAEAVGDEAEYELVEVSSQVAREALLRAPPPPPLDEQEVQALQDADGHMSVAGVALLRERVWQGGVAPSARRVVWPLLLGLRDPHATEQQAAAAATARREQYKALCQAWQAVVASPHTAHHRAWWQSCSRIDKDVGRTDRSHPAFAASGGPACRALRRVLLSYITLPGGREYCQGMSDLAAPLLVVLGDEVDAFWALVALMTRLGDNFGAQQEAIHKQLAALQHLLQLVDPQLHAHLHSVDCQPYFFAFRWLLITFKRDFPYAGALRVWEAVWCCPVSPYMHLYLAAAILVHYRQAILHQVHDFDGMLRFAVQLGGHMEPEPLIRLAGALAAAVGAAADELLAPLTPTRMPPSQAPCASPDCLWGGSMQGCREPAQPIRM